MEGGKGTARERLNDALGVIRFTGRKTLLCLVSALLMEIRGAGVVALAFRRSARIKTLCSLHMHSLPQLALG